MRIAINTRFLLKNRLEGIGTYTFELSKRLVKIFPEHEWLFFFDRNFDKKYVFSDNVKPVIISPPARHPLLWYWWFEKSIPKALKQNKADVFFSPDSYLSLHTDVPQVLAVHDLAFEFYPETIPFLVNKYYRYYIPQFCEKAQKIIAVSERTKKDIIKQYCIPNEKIAVIPNGVSSIFQPSEENIKTEIKNLYSRRQPYFLYVYAIHPRKNVISMFQVFEKFKKGQPALHTNL
ncbi:MAG: glycosyltransferase [Chitinophagales bacterium]|nr:glycosyltransferase [Chitinophagales bacterium]